MRNIRAFSLLEILISITIFGIIFISVGGIFTKFYSDWRKQRDYLMCFKSGRWALDLMSREIRMADTASVDNSTISPYMSEGDVLRFDFADDGGGATNAGLWYWKGKDGYAASGNSTILYRALTDDGKSFASGGGNAIGQKAELSKYLANAFFSVEGTTEKIVKVELTLRPRPNDPVSPGNQNIFLRTKIRPRN